MRMSSSSWLSLIFSLSFSLFLSLLTVVLRVRMRVRACVIIFMPITVVLLIVALIFNFVTLLFVVMPLMEVRTRERARAREQMLLSSCCPSCPACGSEDEGECKHYCPHYQAVNGGEDECECKREEKCEHCYC